MHIQRTCINSLNSLFQSTTESFVTEERAKEVEVRGHSFIASFSLTARQKYSYHSVMIITLARTCTTDSFKCAKFNLQIL